MLLFLFLSPRVPWPPPPAASAESVASVATCQQAGWSGPRRSCSDTPAWTWTLGTPRLCTEPVPATMPRPCACCCGWGQTLPTRTDTGTRRCMLPPAKALMVSVPRIPSGCLVRGQGLACKGSRMSCLLVGTQEVIHPRRLSLGFVLKSDRPRMPQTSNYQISLQISLLCGSEMTLL